MYILSDNTMRRVRNACQRKTIPHDLRWARWASALAALASCMRTKVDLQGKRLCVTSHHAAWKWRGIRLLAHCILQRRSYFLDRLRRLCSHFARCHRGLLDNRLLLLSIHRSFFEVHSSASLLQDLNRHILLMPRLLPHDVHLRNHLHSWESKKKKESETMCQSLAAITSWYPGKKIKFQNCFENNAWMEPF